MSQSLYLKYRPQGFESVVGQEHVIDILKAQLWRQEFNSSYLLYWPRWTWKTSTARLLAKAINAIPNESWVIDWENDTAIQYIQSWETLDFVEIDAASHTWVDNIREEILDKAIYPPTTLRKKIYIIDEVHMLSKWAFNALLKIMEEPRDYLIFILATTEIHKVPDTIISRCQTFTFKNLTIPQISSRLAYIAEQENISHEKDWLDLIAKLSNWALRDGIKYLEQISILGPVTAELVSKFLGVVQWVVLEEMMDAIVKKQYDAFEKILEWLVERGTDLQSLLKDVFGWLDNHFSKNPSTRSPWITIFKEISSEMRRYPQPELLRKKKVWIWCTTGLQQDGHSVVFSTTSASKVKPLEQHVSTIEKNIQTPSSWSESSHVNWQSENNTQMSDIVQEESTKSDDSQPFEWTLDDLLKRMINTIDKKMIQWILSKQTTIDTYEEWKMTLIVINRLYASTLSKDDTIHLLEETVKSITWQSVDIIVKYMSKEDFMKKQLEE